MKNITFKHLLYLILCGAFLPSVHADTKDKEEQKNKLDINLSGNIADCELKDSVEVAYHLPWFGKGGIIKDVKVAGELKSLLTNKMYQGLSKKNGTKERISDIRDSYLNDLSGEITLALGNQEYVIGLGLTNKNAPVDVTRPFINLEANKLPLGIDFGLTGFWFENKDFGGTLKLAKKGWLSDKDTAELKISGLSDSCVTTSFVKDWAKNVCNRIGQASLTLKSNNEKSLFNSSSFSYIGGIDDTDNAGHLALNTHKPGLKFALKFNNAGMLKSATSSIAKFCRCDKGTSYKLDTMGVSVKNNWFGLPDPNDDDKKVPFLKDKAFKKTYFVASLVAELKHVERKGECFKLGVNWNITKPNHDDAWPVTFTCSYEKTFSLV